MLRIFARCAELKLTGCSVRVQKATMDTYVEFPLLFNIQNEGLSAFYKENVAAREAALGRKLNQKGPNFIVCDLHSTFAAAILLPCVTMWQQLSFLVAEL